ncbi:MAG: hypothetical protein JWP69_1158 [Flaviaesturariibacter sp.]|nr:hypothetical protein [Flaviaesturariibacter sp.]
MRKFFTLWMLLLTSIFAMAQTPKGTATVSVSAAQATVEGATVEIVRSKDSSLVRTALTDKKGEAMAENLTMGTYLAKVSMVGYKTQYSAPFSITESNLSVSIPSIFLTSKEASELQNVTVTARKPFIQKLSDRIVVNVENSIVSAGSTALDILERSPGVTVDQDDVISLRGRAGVIIMIDGKISPMTGADLGNYLRGLPSNAIERIEIITNPSAKYDAAGNSGIIDIRLKKDQRLGTNGTLTGSLGKGVYPKAAAGGTLNYRNKKVNVFGNYNHAYRQGFGHLIVNRNFFENGTFIGSDDKDNYGRARSNSNAVRVGADFFPSKNTTLGVVVNSNLNRFRRDGEINTIVNDNAAQRKFTFFTLSNNNEPSQNAVGNINFKHKLDTTGKELTADIDYGIFSSRVVSSTTSSFYNLAGAKFREDDRLDGDQEGELTLKTAKVDYVIP